MADRLGPELVELHAIHASIQGEEPPEWIHLSPAGPLVQGRDGREYRVEDPDKIVERTSEDMPLLIDWDHQSMDVSFGGSTKAAGWVDRVEYVSEEDVSPERPSPGFWGHVEAWTPEGAQDVLAKRFRMLSPVIRHSFLEEGPPLLWSFENVALTNRPNLRMVSLNAQDGGEVSRMDEEQLAELRTLLGLEEDADAAAILEAVREATAEPEPTPDEEQESGELSAAHAALRVLERERDAARAELRKYQEQEQDAERKAAEESVDLAIAEGRAHADTRSDLVRLATSEREEDREMFRRLTAHQIASAPKGRVTSRHEAKPDRKGLSAEERHIFINLRSAGLSEDQAMYQINKRRPAGE